MQTVIPAPPTPTVAVSGEEGRFPVRRIFCVGRNYAAHAREMGKDPEREPPFFFTKPADAVVESGAEVPYPPETGDLQHEIELVVAVGGAGRDVAPAQATGLIYGYAAGIDLTRRDLQTRAKEMGRPWDWGKAFDESAPCGPIVPARVCGHPRAGRIWLAVNGELRQEGDLRELIWDVPEILATISRSMTLAPGDLVFTGTPAGVGRLVPGDRVEGGVADLPPVRIEIAPPR